MLEKIKFDPNISNEGSLYNNMHRQGFPGGYYLANYILNNPYIVVNKTVADLGTGCGIVALACLISGANFVHVVDQDERCLNTFKLHAKFNGISENRYKTIQANINSDFPCPDDTDIITAADLFYKEDATDIEEVLSGFAHEGKLVLASSFDSHLEILRQFENYEDLSQRSSSSQPHVYVRMLKLN